MERGFEIFRFAHFRFPKIGRNAGATVAVCMEPSKLRRFRGTGLSDEDDAIVSIAFCSPREDRFSRSEGRRTAVRKMAHLGSRSSIKQVVVVNKSDWREMIATAFEAVELPWEYKQALGLKSPRDKVDKILETLLEESC